MNNENLIDIGLFILLAIILFLNKSYMLLIGLILIALIYIYFYINFRTISNKTK